MKTRDNLLKRIMTVALSIALAVSMLPLGTPDIYAASNAESGTQSEKKTQTISGLLLFTKSITDSSFNLNARAKTSLSYRSNNTRVATVDSRGNVSIRGVGIAVITITAASSSEYEGATKLVTITVVGRPQTISCKTSYEKTIFDNPFNLNASAMTKLTYLSSNPKVASVDGDGNVVIQGAGTAKIYVTAVATTEYQAETKTVTVKVADAELAKPTIKVTVGKNKATVSWGKIKYAQGYAVQHQYKKNDKWKDGGYIMYIKLSANKFMVYHADSLNDEAKDAGNKTFEGNIKAVNNQLKKGSNHRYRVLAFRTQPEAQTWSAWKKVTIK